MKLLVKYYFMKRKTKTNQPLSNELNMFSFIYYILVNFFLFLYDSAVIQYCLMTFLCIFINKRLNLRRKNKEVIRKLISSIRILVAATAHISTFHLRINCDSNDEIVSILCFDLNFTDRSS